MTDDGALFPLPGADPARPPPAAETRQSAGQKLTKRQLAVLQKGRHPLRGGLLHLEAAPVDDRTAPGRRCGNCTHRSGNERHYPKCMLGPVTHGAATDCRAWWPACRDHTWAASTKESHDGPG